MDFDTAYRATRPTAVDFTGIVAGTPRFFYGRYTRAEHEAFNVRTSAGPVEVVDNVKIAPPVPIRAGDTVEVAGVMVHDTGKPFPIVHWTHHDPQGRRPGGFIRLRGKVYA